MYSIPFNKPFLTGAELQYIQAAVAEGKLSGNGTYTKKCHAYFKAQYGFGACLLTTSCTDALEMAALLIDLKQGDEVILPSYTFVSTANAFVLRGAHLVFADSEPSNPNIDASTLEALITPRTKAIVVVHYAGVACEMDTILAIAKMHNLYVIEDAAQAIDSYYIRPDGTRVPLGSIGQLAAFSFHETKNIIAGEGGLLAINDSRFSARAEIIWEKGTNRAAFFRGETDKYGWVDVGSSFLPSELTAAFLFAQLENMQQIQAKRLALWQQYYERLKPLADAGLLQLPYIPSYATNNAHMFYVVFPDLDTRTKLIDHLKANGIYAAFHYLSLHTSPYYHERHDGRVLPNTDRFADCLLRLPMFYELTEAQVDFITQTILQFFGKYE